MAVRWTVDDRAPTLYTRAYRAGMWLARDKTAFEGARHTLETARQAQRSGNAPPTRWTRLRRTVREEQVAGMPVWTVRPRHQRPVARVVHVHGGGYVHPMTADYWRLARALSDAPAEVVLPAYPLAPDATVDDVLPRLVQLHGQVANRDDLPTVLMGDSAGGALVLAMAARIRDLGGRSPARVVALSPWLDATLDEEAVRDLEPSDPMLAESGLRAAGRWYAGRHRPSDPMVSPVHESLAGLPPIDVFIGDEDILRPAVDDFADRARAQGAELHVHEVSAMFHVWMTRAIPEGRRTRRELARLVSGDQPTNRQNGWPAGSAST
ncbi:MAG TPA: alpha/beta hydrolase [Motilibacteraceae bacterium]|nr:alpha/beta hydrolase [Motilibacteraceae bacterium]